MNLNNHMTELEQLEGQKAKNDSFIKRGEMAVRLANNRDFKKLILEEFCIHECARSVHISSEMTMSAEDRADALATAQAAGHLLRWLQAVKAIAFMAEGQLSGIDQALDEVRAEEALPDDPTNDDGDSD